MGLKAQIKTRGEDKMKIILNDAFYTYFFYFCVENDFNGRTCN